MKMPGRLLVFEGMDGSGKSVLSEATANLLEEQGSPSQLITFPGRIPGTLGHLVYRIHHDANANGINRLSPSSLQTLHIAAHLDAIESLILPALAQGEDVVLDRYWWSTWAYGIAAGASRSIIEALVHVERVAWGPQRPACIFYVQREDPDCQWSEDQQNLKVAYEEIMANEAGNYPIQRIKNENTIEVALEQVMSFVEPTLR